MTTEEIELIQLQEEYEVRAHTHNSAYVPLAPFDAPLGDEANADAQIHGRRAHSGTAEVIDWDMIASLSPL
jgi:hypothetical protein